MSKPRIIERRIDTPASGTRSPMTTTRLPKSIVLEQVQRLKILAAVAAALWTYGFIMDSVVRPATVAVTIPRANLIIQVASIVLAGLMFLYTRSRRGTPERKINAGLGFIVANAAAVAL